MELCINYIDQCAYPRCSCYIAEQTQVQRNMTVGIILLISSRFSVESPNLSVYFKMLIFIDIFDGVYMHFYVALPLAVSNALLCYN